ncbi:MAG: type II secretion system inner membrane protein GspF [Oceanococcaceae bacterium]
MAAFSYVALDARGRKKKGLEDGDTARAVRGKLRERGLTPLEVTEVAQAERGRSSSFGMRPGLPSTTVALFTRQLATLVRSGLPLEESLSTTAQQMDGGRVKAVIMGIRSKVIEGHTLASALAEYDHIFNDMYTATVEAGESTGRLDIVLERLAEYVERRQELQKKIFAALSYPVILVIASIAIVSFLLASVVPQVVGVFANLDAQLPPLTKMLIAASDGLRENWPILVTLLVLAVVGWTLAMRRPHLKARWHRIKLRLPLFGKLERGVNAGRFTRTFSMLVSAGVPVLEAMGICGRVVSNLPMRQAIETAASKVREGAGIARSLGESRLFPPITLNLIANGESSGELDDMLSRAAHNQELEVDTMINAVMGVLGPVLILAMAGIVLTIVLAIMLPIFDMNQLVQ